MAGTRKSGVVRRWDGARGFGFIRGTGDGAEVFFHVRDWRGGAAPEEGMNVNFEEIHVGGKGPRAMDVQRQGVATAAARSPSRPERARRHVARPAVRAGGALWWWPAFFIWLGALAFGFYLQRLPLWALAAVFVLNLVTFFAYMFDKSAARGNAQRTPEKTLHLLSLAGGWVGARLAQQMFRHKSSKQSFQAGYASTVFLHLALLLGWLYASPRLLMA